MINFENEKIVIEIRELIKGINNAKNEADVYCDLMKQILLSDSSKN